jgi:hypothetical protein
METTISIYEKLIIKEVTYEMGDQTVKANCEVILMGQVIKTELIISHTDLNRIIAKVSASGCEFQVKQTNSFEFSNGTSIIDYSFVNIFGEGVVLENFQFSQEIKQIRA